MNNTELPILDKVALVFYGKIDEMDGHNGIGNIINFEACSKTIKHTIMSLCDCDVFTHSWDIECKKQLKEIYKPISAVFQE